MMEIKFNEAKAVRPNHLERCLCYDTFLKGYRCYVYDDISKYWCTQETDEHDPDGENHIVDYADYQVTKWASLQQEQQKVQKVGIGSEIVAPVGQAICIDPGLINPEPKPIQKEQKQEWSEEDQKSLIRAINICISDFGEECETSRFLKSLPERFNLQPKNEWSEEDETAFDNALSGLKYAYEDLINHKSFDSAEDVKNAFAWLKSLRPQPKQEWTEEEKQKLNRIYSIIGWAMDEHAFSSCKKLIGDKEGVELQDFLRSIAKPEQQPSWKPSEEDLMMLEHIIEQYETGNKNSKVMGYLPRVEELNFLKKVFAIWKSDD